MDRIRGTTDYRELLTWADVDAVVINPKCSKQRVPSEFALAFTRNQESVYVRKPSKP